MLCESGTSYTKDVVVCVCYYKLKGSAPGSFFDACAPEFDFSIILIRTIDN
jgi:hypothetical protein